jgi:predicted nucleic acid-binding protein
LSEPLVMDASVLVRLVLEESASRAADSFFFDSEQWYPMLAPSILISETAAAITKKVRRKEIERAFARDAFQNCRSVLDMRIVELVTANDLVDAAFDLSLRLHHPLHDCLYLALARERKAAIATCDGVLADKARGIALEAELICA